MQDLIISNERLKAQLNEKDRFMSQLNRTSDYQVSRLVFTKSYCFEMFLHGKQFKRTIKTYHRV
jgi:hypothetical protein